MTTLLRPTIHSIEQVQGYLQHLYEYLSTLEIPAGVTLLDSQTASTSATLDFTTGIDDTYDVYLFELVNITPASDGVELNLRISQDSGSTWKASANNYEWRQDMTSGSSSTSATEIQIGENLGNAAAESYCGTVRLYNPSNTTKHKLFAGMSTHWNNAGTTLLELQACAGSYNADTAAINGVQFLMSSGNIASGTIYLYGVTKE